MSDLQLSLIALGVALVVAVLVYNKWQERKHRKLAERIFSSDHPDVLLGRQPTADASAAAASAERIEPSVFAADDATQGVAQGVAQDATPASGERAPLGEPPHELADPAIDCIVRFESADPVGGAYLLQTQRLVMDKLDRQLVWCGFDERAGVWERLTANGAGDYCRLRAALQLADRRGPLTDSELTLFFNGVQHMADLFLAVADLPARNDILARAAEVDRFCAGVDIQIGLNVAATAAPFSGARLRGLAEAGGLSLGEDGMFHALDDAGATLFTLSNLEAAPFVADAMNTLATHGVTFTLDVPRVTGGANVFDRMVVIAKQLAIGLGGSLVDDNRAPLPDSALTLIHDKIVEIEQQMAARNLPAGSAQALRLFS
ncbi:MAG: cell division protein ZipA C-terminal FtsZ-binding domain-containing protein [Zoogloeaceae bacterium]|jgi:FtsZ-interacting cell division protein ZipA|nr:cell division protein ZipA C-terminal FtsZ-binding domain-containing protein [Zoogloeaceae bacterium]